MGAPVFNGGGGYEGEMIHTKKIPGMAIVHLVVM
jgi:hypothetical protein